MSRLAVIGIPRTAYTLTESVVQARLHGLEFVLVDRAAALSRLPGSLPVSGSVAVDPLSPGAVADALRKEAVTYVLSFSELHLVLAARVRAKLGLPGESELVEERVRNKAATRSRLRECGLSTVAFTVGTLRDLPRINQEFTVPFMIKPLDLTGSIGVRAIRSAEDAADYPRLFADPDAEAERGREFLIEQFIPGVEYSIEGICVKGRFHLLAVTRKETSGFPAFVEIGHLLPARTQAADDRFAPYLQAVVDALEIGTAPIHAEVKVTGRQIELIEIHTRFGGDLIPLLMERALGVKPLALFYAALLAGRAPTDTGAAPRWQRVAGIWFLPGTEPVDRHGHLRLPRPGPGVDVTVELAGGPGEGPAVLDNFRVPDRRRGHVLFTAADHDGAEGFLAAMKNDWRDWRSGDS